MLDNLDKKTVLLSQHMERSCESSFAVPAPTPELSTLPGPALGGPVRYWLRHRGLGVRRSASIWPTSSQHQCFLQWSLQGSSFLYSSCYYRLGKQYFAPLLSLQAQSWAHFPLGFFLRSSTPVAAFFHPAHCSVNIPSLNSHFNSFK